MRWFRLDNSLSHPLLVPVLLAAVVLVVYYPAIGNGIHSIDDPGIFAFFTVPPPLSDLLLPGRSYYYRPIIEFTYYLDSKLWGMEPSVMHLENVLLHITNTILVFLIFRKVADHYPDTKPIFLILPALLFALHPLNVEAVTWIAGRTDPLAALFILSACLLLVFWLDEPKWQYAACIPILTGLGIVTKETCLAFVPVSLLLLCGWPGLSVRRRLISVLLAVVFVLLLAGVSIFLIWKESPASFGRFLAQNGSGASDWWQNSLVAFGFYVKKLLIPIPLNFAITEVNPSYGLLAVQSIIILTAMYFKLRMPALFFSAAALMIMPVLIVATKQIAWTPFAERYMYMPAAFVCVGTGCLICSLQKNIRNVLIVLLMIVIGIAGVTSFKRNLLWGNKLAFYKDAVARSPGFGSVHNELGVQLLLLRQYDKATEAFMLADRLNKRPSMEMPIKSNIMASMVSNCNYAGARKYFFQLFVEKKAAPANFLEILYTADSKRLESIEMSCKSALSLDLLETLRLLDLKRPDPFWAYRSGQIAVGIGKNHEAADYFRRAYIAAPPDAHYRAAAKTYYLRLEAVQ